MAQTERDERLRERNTRAKEKGGLEESVREEEGHHSPLFLASPKLTLSPCNSSGLVQVTSIEEMENLCKAQAIRRRNRGTVRATPYKFLLNL